MVLPLRNPKPETSRTQNHSIQMFLATKPWFDLKVLHLGPTTHNKSLNLSLKALPPGNTGRCKIATWLPLAIPSPSTVITLPCV